MPRVGVPANFHGKKGQKSGRKSLAWQKNFWDKLDVAIPDAITYCERLLKETSGNCEFLIKQMGGKEKSPIAVKAIQSELLAWKGLGLRAAQVLISKAPQRIEGGGGDGAIVLEILDNKYANILKREIDGIERRADSCSEEGS